MFPPRIDSAAKGWALKDQAHAQHMESAKSDAEVMGGGALKLSVCVVIGIIYTKHGGGAVAKLSVFVCMYVVNGNVCVQYTKRVGAAGEAIFVCVCMLSMVVYIYSIQNVVRVRVRVRLSCIFSCCLWCWCCKKCL